MGEGQETRRKALEGVLYGGGGQYVQGQCVGGGQYVKGRCGGGGQ